MAIGSVIGINNSKSNNSEELTLSSYFGTAGKNETITFTVITSSDDPIYAISSDTNIAVTTVNNKTVSVTGVAYGNVIITVMQENVSSNQTFLCIINPSIGNTLDTTDWETISEISQQGIGDSYWDIGDTKSITLNGAIGLVSLTNFVTNVFILHFNYPMNIIIADNNIIWGGFKDSNGIDIALADSICNSESEGCSNGTKYFTMNHWGKPSNENDPDSYPRNYNYGGWKGCDFRYDILGATDTPPSDYGTVHTTACIGYNATSATLTNPKVNTLLAALPADFRNNLRLWSRWVDAVGNYSNIDANIEETIDAVTLLTEFEVYGTREQANQYEQIHQSQMEYYRLGNSRLKFKHNDTSSEYGVSWWLASPNDDVYFCCGWDGSYVSSRTSDGSSAVAPAFKT